MPTQTSIAPTVAKKSKKSWARGPALFSLRSVRELPRRRHPASPIRRTTNGQPMMMASVTKQSLGRLLAEAHRTLLEERSRNDN